MRESQTTAVSPPRPCCQCSKPEHGTIACSTASDWPVSVKLYVGARSCPYCAASLSIVYDFNNVIHLEKP